MKQNALIVIAGMVLAAALFRLFPHPPNLAPIAAMALFSGAYVADRRIALVLPLAAMLASDLLLGLHSALLLVYACMSISVAIGMQLKNRVRLTTVAGASVLGSIQFFVITNFGVWLSTGMYSPDLSGLAASYVAALPFFHNTLLGDALFSTLLFGGFALYRKFQRLPQERTNPTAMG